ncbi:penicillin-binding transpeptidase domain-containing protein [Klebsiella pneumoniae]|uniref:penicillin-binding transpeptidase domain-containing protein n=1 Tax=Klebsiella pneumoniae TaxID=573 RepID=UPI00396F31D8
MHQQISLLLHLHYLKELKVVLLYDASTNAEIAQFNKAKCATQMAPDSTFKIALSLMAFDAEIDQKTIFKWDKTPKEWRSGTAIIHQRRGCNFLLFGFRKK